ncbi:YhgE/Pip family protein [Levilactobacillus lanxiensis]|uniref:YhgE/Pip family protein n=1 Tax=Levilactobacillus lanxiensis TaxID=2799568 RepID=A0ABW4D2S3_9LACO|nr:YhgE/Pip domain-containing protein [Levilactobacillus lanxiensis]
MIKGEWNYIRHNRLILISVLAIMFIPFLYSIFFLKSVWDPYGETGELPVAVVNQDKPVTYQGQKLNVGDQTITNLKKNKQLGWKFVSAKTAADGLKHHKYYTVITFPKNFSANAATALNKHPKKMTFTYKTNGSANYIAQVMSEVGSSKLDSEIRAKVTKAYAQATFKQIFAVGKGMDKAAKGSAQLKNGTVTLTDGLNTYTTGVHTLNNGLQQMKTSVTPLATGIQQLSTGAKTLQTGLGTYTAGVGQFASGVNTYTSGVGQYTSGVNQFTGGVSKLSAGMPKLTAGTSQLASGAKSLKSGTYTYVNGVYTLNSGVKTLGKGSTSLASGVTKLADGSKSLNSGLSTLSGNSKSLNDGATALATGATTLKNGVDQLETELGNMAAMSGDLTQAQGLLQDIQYAASISGSDGTSMETASGQLYTAMQQLMAAQAAAKEAAASAQAATNQIKSDVAGSSTGTSGSTSGNETVKKNIQDTTAEAETLAAEISSAKDDATVSTIKDKVTALQGKLATISKDADNITAEKQASAATANASLLKDATTASDAQAAAKEALQNVQAKAAELLNIMQSANLDDNQAAVLKAFMTGKSQDVKDQMTKLSADLQALSALNSDGNKKQLKALKDGATALSTGATQLSTQLPQYTSGVDQAFAGSTTLNNGLSTLNSQVPTLTDGVTQIMNGTAKLAKNGPALKSGSKKVAAGATQLNGGLKTAAAGVNQLNANTGKLTAAGNKLNANTPKLTAAGNKLTSASSQLTNGAGQLTSGLNTLNSKVPALTSGVNQLADGSQQLDDNSNKLMQGANKLKKGNGTLAKSLKSGADQLKAQPLTNKTADMFAAPTHLKHESYSYVPNYGHALAPYVLSVALYVGALVFNFAFPIRKVSREGGSATGWYLSKVSIGAAEGLAMGLIEPVLMMLGGLSVDHPGQMILISIFFAEASMFIVMFLSMLLDNPGRFIAMVLLMLQLGGSGGTFPMEVTNHFYNVVHPFLPMTYSILGFREAITSGMSGMVGQALWVLALFTIIGLALLWPTMIWLQKKHLMGKSQLDDNQKLQAVEDPESKSHS